VFRQSFWKGIRDGELGACDAGADARAGRAHGRGPEARRESGVGGGAWRWSWGSGSGAAAGTGRLLSLLLLLLLSVDARQFLPGGERVPQFD